MFLTLSCAAVAFLGAAPILQASESITDEISAKYLGRIDSAQKNEDWETLFHLYEEALRRHRYRVAPDPEHAGIQLGMVEYLIRRYAGLPQAAFDHYRLAMDGRAQQALEMAAREKDPLQLDRMLSLYFFSSMSDEYHDRLALQLQERGLFDDALLYWDRLLRYYPDSDIPPEVLLARMAVACQLAGSASQLSELVEFQAERKIDGFIWAGREKRKISEFLSSLKISPGRDNFSRPPPMPDVSRRTHGEQPRYVRNDVMWWTFEFETKAKSDPARRTGVVNQGLSDYPLLPAYCRLKGNPYVIFTDGFQVVSVNPDRVRRGSRIEGVYWRYPANGPLKISSTSRVYGVSYSPPYIGVTVEGEYAFATLYAQKRISPNNQDSFSGPTRLVCFQISTGRVVWSTDELYATVQGMERREQQAYDFLERNHAFSGPPLVRGGKVFLGICSSPSAEQEARVLCLDSRTGAPLWSTFLASLRSAGNRFRSRGGTLKPFLPMMVEEGGRLYVQTSLGVVAAIRSTTGNAVWLSRYRRDVKIPTWNVQTPNTLRPANAPLLYGGRVWILPQDSKVLLAFDRKTGESVLLPRVGLKGGVLPWAEIKRLLGVIDGWMVLGGASSYVLRLRDYYSGSLANANTAACGRGQIVGEDIYFSIESGGRNGSLGLYAGSGSWKKQWTSEWKGKNQKGNLLVAGNTLVVASDQIHFYSDVETVRDRFSSRVNQSPPRLDVLLSYAELMDQNGMREDAIEAYEEYVRLMKPVESEMGIYWKVRHRLHEIFLEYGEELATSSGTGILQYFRKAMAYAPDQETGAKMTWKIGAYLAKVGRNREAVEELQKIIEKYPDYIFPVPSEKVAIRLGEYGRRMISGIRAKDPQACQGIEDRAGKALRNCSGDDLDGWKKIRRLYPDSRAAEKAAQFLLAAHLKREEWVEALVLQKERISPGDPRTLLNLLEKIGDRERLVSELKSWGREFGDQVVVVGEQHRRVHEIVRDWLQKIAAEQGPTPELPEGPLKRMGSPIKNILDGSLYALDPAGIIPPMFPPGAVLLQQGVSVELRNVEDGTRRWVVHHPSGYSGINVRAEGIRAKVHRVDPGSPGARAGIKPGDVIESVNGSYGTHESISRHLRSGKPGKGLRLQVRRGGKPLPYSFKLDTMPPDKGRSILWASFTRGYSLAIVWEDAVAAVDIRTGKVEWLFSTIPDSFSIREVRADEGKLFLYGSRKPGWMLVCLEDSTGGVQWIRDFPVVANGGGLLSPAVSLNRNAHRAWIYPSLQGESVSLFRVLNTGSSELQIFDWESGSPLGKPQSFPRGVLSHTVDKPTGMVHLVHGASPRNREIVGVSLRSGDAGKQRYSIPIPTGNNWTDLRGCRLFTRDPYLILIVPAGMKNRIGGTHVFDLRKERLAYSIPLREGRTWSMGTCEDSPLDSDGTLYLYSETAPVEPGNRVGFLGAYTLGEAPVLKWEAIAPALPPSAKARWRLETDMKNHLLFVSPQGGIPGERGEVPVAVLYSRKKGGYLEQVFSDLDGRLRGRAVSNGRGRLLISTQKGVEVYGSR